MFANGWTRSFYICGHPKTGQAHRASEFPFERFARICTTVNYVHVQPLIMWNLKRSWRKRVPIPWKGDTAALVQGMQDCLSNSASLTNEGLGWRVRLIVVVHIVHHVRLRAAAGLILCGDIACHLASCAASSIARSRMVSIIASTVVSSWSMCSR